MTAEDSPIREFYPSEFKVDRNGFRHDWQGVTLLPFVDEEKVLSAAGTAMTKIDKNLQRLNKFGQCSQLDLIPAPCPYVSGKSRGYCFW